jgi:hypothetical protein
MVTIEKFETNPVSVNVNKLKPYKYIEFEFRKKQQMLIYWEKTTGEVQEVNSNTEEDDEGC